MIKQTHTVSIILFSVYKFVTPILSVTSILKTLYFRVLFLGVCVADLSSAVLVFHVNCIDHTL